MAIMRVDAAGTSTFHCRVFCALAASSTSAVSLLKQLNITDSFPHLHSYQLSCQVPTYLQ